MPDSSFRPRRAAIIGVALLMAACIPGLLMLHVEVDMTGSWMTPLTPSSQRYIEYLERFPSDSGALVVVTGGFETAERWAALAALTDDLEALDVVDRVESLTTAEYVRGDDALVEIVDAMELTPEPGAALADFVRGYPPYQHVLITPDGFAAGIYARAAPGVAPPEFAPAIQAVIDHHRPEFLYVDGGDVFQTGEMRVNAELARLTVQSTSLVGLTVLIMFAMAALLSRSWVVGVLAAAAGGLSAAVTFALMGYVGITMTPVNSMVACMFVPLGAASVLHADAYARHSIGRMLFGCVPADSLRPFAFAAATTMAAFGATAISGYGDIQQFGLLGVFGIGASMALVVLAVFPILPKRPAAIAREPLAETAGPPKTLTVVVFVALVGVCGWGGTRIQYSFGPSDYFTDENPVLADFNRAGPYFGRYAAPYVVIGDAENAALDPALWERLRAFEQRLEAEFPGTHAAWPYESVSALSRAYTAADAAPQAFPDSAELLAQYLVLFDEQDLESYLDWDRSSITVMFQTPFRNSGEYRVFRDRAAALADELGIDGGFTGRIPVFFDAADKVTAENMESIAIGGAAIWVLLFIVVRSLMVSLIAVAVNLLPVAGTLAFFGLFGVPLDIPMSLAAAIALGLVVDDTGHMVARYDVLRRAGTPAEHAARRVVHEYWRPVLFTSITIVAGFVVMNLAPLRGYHTFSWMICFTMAYALLGDLLFLPALLAYFDRRRFPNAREKEGPAGN